MSVPAVSALVDQGGDLAVALEQRGATVGSWRDDGRDGPAAGRARPHAGSPADPRPEYALHRNDLEWALGNQEPLAGDVTATALEGLPSLLPMMAAGTGVRTVGERPIHPLGARLQGRSSTLDVAWTGVSWEIGRLCDPVVSVAGDDSSVVLFVGRLPITHPGLRVTGDPASPPGSNAGSPAHDDPATAVGWAA